MAPFRTVAGATLVLAVAITLQGCKKTAPQVEHQPVEHPSVEHHPAEHKPEEHKPEEHKPKEHKHAEHKHAEHKHAEHKPEEHKPKEHKHHPAEHKHAEHAHPKGRVAVDKKLCEHKWKAKWPDHTTSVCRSFCCYHHDRKTHKRSKHSYCRVREHGHEVLKACKPVGVLAAFSALEMTEAEPLALTALGTDSDVEAVLEEEEEEEQGAGAQRSGALLLFACITGFALGAITVFLALRPRLRIGSVSEEHYAPFIES